MNMLLRRLPILAALVYGFGLAQAQDVPGSIDPHHQALRINGFGSVGVTSTHAPAGWYFRRDAAQYPVEKSTALDTDTRIGLQAHYEVDPQLELASQLVLKRRLPGSKPMESVEWLFASYKPTGSITLRAGRTNPDLFLLSDYRNVGVAYPWVRPNVELYAALPLYTIDGADASYVWSQGDARWRVKAFAGSIDARATLAYSPEQVNFKLRAANGMLITHEQGGLLVRATLAQARMTAQLSDETYQANAVLDGLKTFPDPSVAQEAMQLSQHAGLITDTVVFAELGASYDQDNWLWSAEYSLVHAATGTRSAQSGYVSVGRRVGDFTFFGMTGRIVSRLGVQPTPNWSSLGPSIQALGAQAAYAINASRSRQTSLSLGTRWDFHPQMAAKFQVDHFWVSNMGGGLWVGRPLDKAQPNVLSATLDFTF